MIAKLKAVSIQLVSPASGEFRDNLLSMKDMSAVSIQLVSSVSGES